MSDWSANGWELAEKTVDKQLESDTKHGQAD
jgi:hypothetical protein